MRLTNERPDSIIHSVEAYERSKIEQTLKTCATCNDEDIACSSHGAYVVDE